MLFLSLFLAFFTCQGEAVVGRSRTPGLWNRLWLILRLGIRSAIRTSKTSHFKTFAETSKLTYTMAIDVIQLECKENKTRNPSSLLGLVPRASASGRGSGSRHSQTIADTEPSRIRSRSVDVVVVFVGGGFNVVSSASTSVKYSQNCNNFGSGCSNSLLAKFRRQQERYVCNAQAYVPHVGRQLLEISIWSLNT